MKDSAKNKVLIAQKLCFKKHQQNKFSAKIKNKEVIAIILKLINFCYMFILFTHIKYTRKTYRKYEKRTKNEKKVYIYIYIFCTFIKYTQNEGYY